MPLNPLMVQKKHQTLMLLNALMVQNNNLPPTQTNY